MLLLLLYSIFLKMYTIMAQEEINSCVNQDLKDFAGDVGYGLHAVTIQDIKYFFGYDVAEENGIPTMNLNLTQENKVLDNAPSFLSSFRFPTARKLDLVMMNSEQGDNFYQVGATYREKLSALYYSLERLFLASKIYKKVLKMPIDYFEEECKCVSDKRTNDEIKSFLLELAEIMRALYPSPEDDGSRKPPEAGEPFYAEFKDKEERCHKPEIQTQLKQLCSEMPPELKDSKSWGMWKAMKRNGYNEKAQHRLALYFYCKGREMEILPELSDEGEYIPKDLDHVASPKTWRTLFTSRSAAKLM